MVHRNRHLDAGLKLGPILGMPGGYAACCDASVYV